MTKDSSNRPARSLFQPTTASAPTAQLRRALTGKWGVMGLAARSRQSVQSRVSGRVPVCGESRTNSVTVPVGEQHEDRSRKKTVATGEIKSMPSRCRFGSSARYHEYVAIEGRNSTRAETRRYVDACSRRHRSVTCGTWFICLPARNKYLFSVRTRRAVGYPVTQTTYGMQMT